jgi:hypothetical protein
VTSLTPLDPFDTHLSWKAAFGAMTRLDDCDACLAGRVALGAGGAVALGRPLTLFLTADTEVLYAPAGGWRIPFRAGAGPAAGLLLRAASLSLLATADTLFYPWQTPARLWHARATVRVPLHATCSLFTEAATQRSESSLRGGVLLYF